MDDKRRVKFVAEKRIDSCGEMWTRLTHPSKIIELQTIKQMCESVGIKPPKRLLLCLALCLSGEFRYAPSLKKSVRRDGR